MMLKVINFWVVTPYSLICRDHRFGEKPAGAIFIVQEQENGGNYTTRSGINLHSHYHNCGTVM
jgi:hypothetical protein